jgi:metal-dependent hydrolase (beta-lactamase superfamily II)
VWQTALPDAPTLAATSRLEIIALYEEASTGDKFISGHGVSYLIRTDSGTILLDVGNNPDQLAVSLFMQNMQTLGIAWDEIDAIVVTHLWSSHNRKTGNAC